MKLDQRISPLTTLECPAILCNEDSIKRTIQLLNKPNYTFDVNKVSHAQLEV